MAATAAVEASPGPALTREQAAVEQARQRLAEAQAALLENLRRQELLRSRQAQAARQLAALDGERRKFEEKSTALDARRRQVEQGARQAELSLVEVRRRTERLVEEIAALKKLPPARKTLRYQTPVAQAVQSEELQFECRRGKVSFVDVEGMLREVRRGMRDKARQLRSRWEVEAETGVHGAFRLRYVVVRERGVLDGGSGAIPDERAEFRYGLESWVAVPATPERGETLEAALRPGSEFRRIVDRLDAEQTAVTFWVYPDSFATYRLLRDYLLRRDVLVAGRPLPDDFPIASSRSGTVSQGQ
jgi:multidrug efflux pump subunit AcrA (membrane-fusion protein)